LIETSRANDPTDRIREQREEVEKVNRDLAAELGGGSVAGDLGASRIREMTVRLDCAGF
jgi:putative heme degradation protein